MSRNRKRQAGGFRWGPLVLAIFFCGVVGGASLGYVWQKDQIRQLGQQIKEAEIRYAKVLADNEQRRKHLADMRSEKSILRQNEILKLGLVEAQPSQFWRLPEPSLTPEPVRVGSQYAAHAPAQR